MDFHVPLGGCVLVWRSKRTWVMNLWKASSSSHILWNLMTWRHFSSTSPGNLVNLSQDFCKRAWWCTKESSSLCWREEKLGGRRPHMVVIREVLRISIVLISRPWIKLTLPIDTLEAWINEYLAPSHHMMECSPSGVLLRMNMWW